MSGGFSHSATRRLRAWPTQILVVSLLGLFFGSAHAEDVATNVATVNFAPGNTGAEGYAHASVQVRYALLYCGGDIRLSIALVRDSGTASGNKTGSTVHRWQQPFPHPKSPTPQFKGLRLDAGSLVGPFSMEPDDAREFACMTGDPATAGRAPEDVIKGR